MSLNWLDIILLAILLVTFILGIIKGFIRQIVGILAVIIGLIFAVYNYSYVAFFYTRFISSRALTHLLGFLTIFLVVLCMGWLVSYLLSKLMKGPLKFLNHVFGGVLGLLKGILICGVIVFALLVFPVSRTALTESQVAPYCLKIAEAAYYLIPQSLKQEFKKAYREMLGKEGKHEERI
ncbi:MAG: CvpA family protein [Candidatus Aminicenantales bacterium]